MHRHLLRELHASLARHKGPPSDCCAGAVCRHGSPVRRLSTPRGRRAADGLRIETLVRSRPSCRPSGRSRVASWWSCCRSLDCPA
eukprot:5780826-Pyramimonas_sp.AAC.1